MTFNSGCRAGLKLRNAPLTCAGAPGETQQLWTAWKRALLMAGPRSGLASPLSCARSILSKTEKPASSLAGSARISAALTRRAARPSEAERIDLDIAPTLRTRFRFASSGTGETTSLDGEFF